MLVVKFEHTTKNSLRHSNAFLTQQNRKSHFSQRKQVKYTQIFSMIGHFCMSKY